MYYKVQSTIYSKNSVDGHLYVTANFFGPVECYGKNILTPLYTGHSNKRSKFKKKSNEK